MSQTVSESLVQKDNELKKHSVSHFMFRQVILDFDGVILESVSVKTEAFRTLFSQEQDHVNEIVEYHIKNGGMSRFEKFRYIYKHILKKNLDQDTFNSLSEQFSGLVFQGVLDAPFVAGAERFLERWNTRIPLSIVSATPEQELNEILRARNLTRYFRNVFGAPSKKADCIQRIITESGVPASGVLFVGDALNDLAAARLSGVNFIGRTREGDEDIFKNCTGVERTITDLNELSRYLECAI